MTEPLRCPFCKCVSINVIESTGENPGHQATCAECGARGPIYDTENDAVRGWNSGVRDLNARFGRDNP